MSKLISTLQVRFDDETKAEIASLKGKLDVVAHRLNVGHAMPTGGLLAVMAGEAANDSNSAIDRETINDVDYLSTSLDESVPYIDNAVEQNYWLSPSVPKITDADMQLIFIKNLSDVLIQRMHSMDRFSEDDYAIGVDDLMVWDCLIEAETGRFAIVSGIGFENRTAIINTFNQDFNDKFFAAAYTLDLSFLKKTSTRTITEAELPAFRAALEACYV